MSPDAAGRETFTDRARRKQLVTVTIDLVAEVGYARSSLQRIADAAGITKAAVPYHFPSKHTLIQTAYDHVLTSMTEYMGRQIEAARTPAEAVDTYVSALIGYLAQHPTHMRMIVESLDDHRTEIRRATREPPARLGLPFCGSSRPRMRWQCSRSTRRASGHRTGARRRRPLTDHRLCQTINALVNSRGSDHATRRGVWLWPT